MSLIELKHVSKTYVSGPIETKALKEISFTVNSGEFISIMGPSGSGKSTLLHILGLLDRPSSGTYLFHQESVDKLSDQQLAHWRNKEIGFIFQRFNLLKRMSVYENVQVPLLYSGIPKKQWDKLIRSAIESVGLEHRINHLSSELSGGESQRVAIARAIVNEPSIIFADEPTGNLDSKTGEQIMHIIDDLHQKGATVILITHETAAAAFSKRIIRLKDGSLQSDRKKKQSKKGFKK